MEQQNHTTHTRDGHGQYRQTTTPLLVTIAEAAHILCVSQRTIYRMIERGRIAVVKVTADAPRVRRADLDALVA
ncbi:MAG: helix-turn-helix domain-containing protein [Fibrella sp.]|nr:helix-turn-helix domain-containing protein [Armatimonadota bacterium]